MDNSIDLIIVYSSFVLFGDGCPSSLSIAPTPVVEKQANVKTALRTLYNCTGVVMRVKQRMCCYDVHRGMCVATVYTGACVLLRCTQGAQTHAKMLKKRCNMLYKAFIES